MPDVPVTITIDYTTVNGITASPATISEPTSDTVDVTWAITTNVQQINNISVPTGVNSQGNTVFLNTPTQSGTIWSLDDAVPGQLPYTYTVTLVTSGGTTVTSDPQIVNDPPD